MNLDYLRTINKNLPNQLKTITSAIGFSSEEHDQKRN